jgi:hypothetical protein
MARLRFAKAGPFTATDTKKHEGQFGQSRRMLRLYVALAC